MIVAACIRNLDDWTGVIGISQRTMDDLGEVALTLFLVMALMTLRLWELAGVVVPLFVILAMQVALVVALCLWAIPRLMGRDYDAVVMAGGFCGFMLGTTANAMANMGALVERYGPAPKAYLVVPLVGAFGIDFVNGLLITDGHQPVAINVMGRESFDQDTDQTDSDMRLSYMTPDLPRARAYAAPLAYAGWWVTGALFWFLERRDSVRPLSRRAGVVVFGAIAVVVALLSRDRRDLAAVHAERLWILGVDGGPDLGGRTGVVAGGDLERGERAACGGFRLPPRSLTGCVLKLQLPTSNSQALSGIERLGNWNWELEVCRRLKLRQQLRLDRAVGVLELVLIPIHVGIARHLQHDVDHFARLERLAPPERLRAR